MKQTIGALAGLVLTGVFGQASVIYTFVGTGTGTIACCGIPDEPVAFTLTLPTFITIPNGGFAGFTCAQLDSSTNCQSSASFPQIDFINGDLPRLFQPVITED